jgi:hypothetical protein
MLRAKHVLVLVRVSDTTLAKLCISWRVNMCTHVPVESVKLTCLTTVAYDICVGLYGFSMLANTSSTK